MHQEKQVLDDCTERLQPVYCSDKNVWSVYHAYVSIQHMKNIMNQKNKENEGR